MAFYLNLFSPETWASSKETGFTISGFRARQSAAVQRVQVGDVFLCYLVGLSRWCGALRVESNAFDDDTPVYSDPDIFTVRFKTTPVFALDPDHGIPIFEDSIWNGLSLTRDIAKGATGWATAFRGSLRKIPEQDGNLILEHLAVQAEEKRVFALTERDKRQLARRASVPSPKGLVIVEVPHEDEDDDPTLSVNSETEVESGDIRESLKVQATLTRLGSQLGFKVWIAPGDRKQIAAQDGVDSSVLLSKLPVNYETATMNTIEQIDVIWIKGRSIARAFEVEHTTAIYSGLLRMADLLALQPNLAIKLHIVAPNDKREKVLRELRRPVFSLLENGPLYDSCTYLSYSALDSVSSLKHLSHMSDGVLDEYDEHANDITD